MKRGMKTKGAKKAAAKEKVRTKKEIKKHKGKRHSSQKIASIFDEDYLGMRLAELDEEIEDIKLVLACCSASSSASREGTSKAELLGFFLGFLRGHQQG